MIRVVVVKRAPLITIGIVVLATSFVWNRESSIDHAKKAYALYEPVIITGLALRELDEIGQPLPETAGELWHELQNARTTQPKERVEKAKQFLDHGLYLRNFRDTTGKQHRARLLYHAVLPAQKERIYAISSESWLNTQPYRFLDAEELFGKETVADLLRRSRFSRPRDPR